MGKISARDLYESHVGTMLETVWTREGEKLQYNPVDLRTPLCDVMDRERDGRVEDHEIPLDEKSLSHLEWEELVALVLDLKSERDDTRANTLHTMLNFLFAEGPNPVKVSERAFILARALGPNNVWNMKQWEAGAMHGLIRATWQQMEKRIIEELAARMSSTGVFTLPGGKSHSARQRYSKDKQGNTSRKYGRRQGDQRADVRTSPRRNGSRT